MGEVLRAVPGLYWMALVWVGLAVWAEDVRGIYIAVACAVIATIQLFRAPSRSDDHTM
mgnify:FL=1